MIQRWLDECKMLDLRIGFLLRTAIEFHDGSFTDQQITMVWSSRENVREFLD